MTPQERQLIDDLFARLTALESNPRDREAEQAIARGLALAPHAIYPLVQTVLVQDEALKRADARIRALSGEEMPRESGGFLDNMRSLLTGQAANTSVPSVRPAANEADPRWNRGGVAANPVPQAAPSPGFGGGSFLGTAAATAAGVIGGTMLMNSIGSMFGHHSGSAFADVPPTDSPWSGGAGQSELARDAGAGDIGHDRASGQGLVDDGGFDGDFSGDAGGDSGGGDSA
jgi:hypothetical protein